MKKFLWYWAPVILYAGLIFYLSSIPITGLPGPGPAAFRDKYWHLLEFFVLAALLLRAGQGYRWRHAYYFAILFAILYGALDELHQSFVPGRVASIVDVAMDGVGALCVLVFKKWKR
ncbi:MAG TPA: VanZ family protein [Candidatus Nanoarchaeia archaeon]|nr:VanZ family protein [Candidatus Nanoarchaeia archaeon]